MTSRDPDERGATAVLVGILALFMVGLVAFTTDAGVAFVSNRNLQRAADAGALAAAQSLTQTPGSCDLATFREGGEAWELAHARAQEVAQDNYPKNVARDWGETDFDIDCDPDLKVLIVTFGNQGTTDTVFAPIFGGDEEVTTTQDSEATIDVAPGAGENVRPLALCSAAVGDTEPGEFVQIFYPGHGTKSPPQCPKPKSAGNWWTLDCPEERGGATTVLEDQIRNGCTDRVTVIPGQSDVDTPGQLTVVLEDACPAAPIGSETCMSGDPGNLDAGHIADAWEDLVDTEKESIFPVFCVSPQCSEDTTSGSGTGTVFPVYKLVSAIVCGYHFSKKEKKHSTTGKCEGNPFLAEADPDDSSGNNYLVLKYISTRTSGTHAESECALGAECDGGLRRTRLTGGGGEE
nr:pilus assembly protein TadG-related protein [Nocardioides sp. zg-1230]